MTLTDAILLALPCADGVPMRTADVVLAVRSAAPEHDAVTEASVSGVLIVMEVVSGTVELDETDPRGWAWRRTAKGDAHPAVVARRKAMEEAR